MILAIFSVISFTPSSLSNIINENKKLKDELNIYKKEEEKKLKNQLHNELMIKKGRKQSVLFNLNSNNLNKKTENNNNIVININDEDDDSDEKDNITPKKIFYRK